MPVTDAELLRYIAREEPLDQTLEAFPELTPAELRKRLAQLADRLEAQAPPPATPKAVPTARTAAPQARTGGALGTTTASKALRVYSDGAARGNPGPSGAGAVIVDLPTGQILERLGKFLGHQTNNYAEYMAVVLGLKRARELGAETVEVYADSQLMIRQLGGQYAVKSASLRPLYTEAVALLSSFKKVKLVHIPREMNTEADEMSNRAIDERMS